MEPSLVESASLSTNDKPTGSVRLSSSSYVLSIASLPSHYAASASAPSNTIDLFDKSTLRGVQTLQGHDVGTTSLRTIGAIAGAARECLMSSGQDGLVKVWDERANAAAIQMTSAGRARPLLCCDAAPDGRTVAAGTVLEGDDALILYWDPRQPAAPLHTHASTHADDVTAVHFAPRAPGVLLSASSDGLVSTSRADERDEDEAVRHVGNWGCSVAQAGWLRGGAGVWACSDMETFSTWSGELDLRRSLDIRAPSVHTPRATWVTDYVVAGPSAAPDAAGLGVFVGSNEGDIALIANEDYALGAPWTLQAVWAGAHVGVVRSVLWDSQNNVLLTGGEDSLINSWSIPEQLHSAPSSRRGKRELDDDWAMDTQDDQVQEGKRHRRE